MLGKRTIYSDTLIFFPQIQYELFYISFLHLINNVVSGNTVFLSFCLRHVLLYKQIISALKSLVGNLEFM